MSALFITCEPMLCYYGVILMPLFVSIVLVLALEATVLETSLILWFVVLGNSSSCYNSHDEQNRIPWTWTLPRITQHTSAVGGQAAAKRWTAAQLWSGQLDAVSRAEKRQASIRQTVTQTVNHADCCEASPRHL